ncbi:MAG TPA: EF-P lysine aminoacylase EpmA [Candidatus Paceibacterota bacterium]|nr:EF-P lysine aminoacylase EpmA [Candidatus Paceibacterota bacterium]
MKQNKEQILKGRIIEYDAIAKTGILKTEDTVLPFALGKKTAITVGSIVSLQGKQSMGNFQATMVKKLKEPELNFEEWWNKNAKNWQKGVTDPSRVRLIKQKATLAQTTRDFFSQKKFTEVFTPLLNSVPGMEPFLDPIKTSEGWLITSPEYNIKKLLATGIGDVFEITKSFRGHEENSPYHNAEFTILEWYRSFADYTQVMYDLEQLVLTLNQSLGHGTKLNYNHIAIDLKTPWLRLKVNDACKKWAHLDLNKCQTIDQFKKAIKTAKLNIDIDKIDDWNDLFYSVFLNYLEPQFPKNKPIIIYDYPLPQGALAKRKSKTSFWTERFEFYLGGIEIGNCFSELTNGQEQQDRFEEEQKIRNKIGKEVFPLDNDLIEALKIGLPPTSGIAIGLDRLFMLLLGLSDLREYLDFPTNQV